MAKKYDIKDLNNFANSFVEYLEYKLNSEAFAFIEGLTKKCEVFIFSGVIRNFFIKHKGRLKDLDLVVSHNDKFSMENEILKYEHRINSFDGYKIKIKDLVIDIWELESTWAIKKNKIETLLFNSYNLPSSAFFNFSAVIFDLRSRKFYATSDFIDFINTEKIDLVLKDNPLPELCIINTIYYKTEYNLKLSQNLKQYFLDNFQKYNEEQYIDIQLKHLKKVLFSYEYLKVYNDIFKKELQNTK